MHLKKLWREVRGNVNHLAPNYCIFHAFNAQNSFLLQFMKLVHSEISVLTFEQIIVRCGESGGVMRDGSVGKTSFWLKVGSGDSVLIMEEQFFNIILIKNDSMSES